MVLVYFINNGAVSTSLDFITNIQINHGRSFQRWVRTLEQTQGYWTDIAPPLDVLMVWHAYLLNPRYVIKEQLRTAFTLLFYKLQLF
jgi:hypothetical protein